MRRAALALYAVGLFLAFPQELPGGIVFDLGWLFAWIAPAALVVGIAGLAPGRAARAAFVASLVAHWSIFYWFFVVTVRYGGLPAVLGVITPLLPTLYFALLSAAFAWGWARFACSGPAPVWAGAMLWVALDWVRAHFVFGGFPWSTLGYALHQDVPLLAWMRWTGVYGLSFLAVATGIAIARVVLDRSRARTRDLAITLALVALAHGVGAAMGGAGLASPATVRIAAVQGNIDQGRKWDARVRDEVMETYLRLSGDAVDRGAEWIVWPETAVPGLVEVDPVLRDRIERFARERQVTLVIGGTGVEIDRAAGRFSAFFDSAFLVDPAGLLLDRYDKTHLVPFGEYVPFRATLGRFFQALATGLSSTDVSAGPAPRSIEIRSEDASVPTLRAGVPICYELLFPHLVRHFVADRAGVLLAITNDAWYGRTGAPHQFLALTALRAAENGRWVVRAANTGISAIIDARGRVRQASPLFEEAVLVADVPVATEAEPTFYTRFGDVFAGLCIVASAVLLGRRAWLDRRRPDA
jgi:apolipoprotein N-acyltransferase